MARPPMPPGTAGTIRFYKVSRGYRARTLVRDLDGRTREIERTAPTKTAAQNAVKSAIRDRSAPTRLGGITRDTTVADLAETWYTHLADRSPNTLRVYRDRIDRQVIPGLGALKIWELSPGLLDGHLNTVATRHGPATAKLTRTVLSGMCRLATRHNALPSNPTRDVSTPSTRPKKAPRSLTVAEARQLMALLTYDTKAVERDLPDLVAFMLATGLRIGEATATTHATLNLDTGTVEVRGTVVRVRGEGVVIKPELKSPAGHRTLQLPSWCVTILQRRTADAIADTGTAPQPDQPVFPAPRGGLRDPSNTQADLRDAFITAGYPWLTSHNLRKTVATLMDDAGLTPRSAADQLGHANPALTQNVYYGRTKTPTGANIALEPLDPAW